MKFNAFIGVDVSKLTIDAHLHEINASKTFSNNEKGFNSLLNWAKKHLKSDELSKTIICFEHTGMYSIKLAIYLNEEKIAFAMLPALQIKQSIGIRRGKNDQVDAKRIAEYAWLQREALKASVLPAKSILKLQSLLTLRDRLVRDRGGFEATWKEQLQALEVQVYQDVFNVYKTLVDNLTVQIKKTEQMIKAVIENDEQIKENYQLVTSIKGVGPVVAAHMIAYTHNFTRFSNWRKFACYVGTAPFEHQSGTSVRGRTRVSTLSNKQLKKVIHLAAISACAYNAELKTYYKKRISEGKNKMCTLNVIRNKLIARMFAVVNRGTAYVDLMKHAA
jgi:transposase